MNIDLAGRTALVTGSTRGIGRAIAEVLAESGARVAVVGRDLARAQEAASTISPEARGFACDVGDVASVTALVEAVEKEFGGIDILVNNAAHQASFKEIEEISDEEWELTFKVNVHAMFYLTKAAVPHMKAGGVIINTASINSDAPSPALLAYATTKGAIQNFTAGLAQLLAEKGIRANAVAPGPIWTPLIPSTLPQDAVAHFGKQVPMKRPGQPAELATAYVMLADPLSSYVSGATIAVTGGKPIL